MNSYKTVLVVIFTIFFFGKKSEEYLGLSKDILQISAVINSSDYSTFLKKQFSTLEAFSYANSNERSSDLAPSLRTSNDKFNHSDYPSTQSGVNSSSHLIVNNLPNGYVKDGSVDYTSYIQMSIDKYNNLVFPPFPLLINDSGLKIGSNKSITFLKGSELRLKPSLKKGYHIIDINQSTNVVLYNPVIKGDRYHHLGNGGEWGMGLSIRGSNNVKVFGAHITDCWGDGIYIGEIGKNHVPKNIVIKNAHLSKNRRDGISIISVDGLILENIYAGFQDGTLPMCGINFETDNPECEIKNVKVINPVTEHNKGSGIQIQLSTLLGKNFKSSNIKIINHVDVGSKSFAVKVACNKKVGVVGGSVAGLVSIVNPFWKSTIGDRPLTFVTDQSNLKVIVSSPRVKKSNGHTLTFLEIRNVLRKHSNGDLKIL